MRAQTDRRYQANYLPVSHKYIIDNELAPLSGCQVYTECKAVSPTWANANQSILKAAYLGTSNDYNI